MGSSIYQTYGALLVSALLPIIAGSSSSLKAPKSVKDTLKVDDDTEDEEDEDEDDSERITTTDALYFPLLASVSLGSLYLAFKYLNKDTINKIMGYYFSLMGIGSLSRSIIAAARVLLGARFKKLDKFKLILEKNSKPYTYLSFNYVHLTSLFLSIILTVVNFYYSHWTLSNLVALVFSWNAISLVKLDSFRTGASLLGGLFFYDIYWVFFSEVMVSVATNFDAPIKIVWPKNLGAGTGFSLLGLGDIVVPGIFIAFALRFDYHLAIQRQTPAPFPSGRYPKPYFLSSFFAYIIGLITCIYVMHTFKAAQPALLYLSPLCTLSVVLVALIKGELKVLWEFEEGEGSEDEKIEKKEIFLEKKEEDSAVSTAVEEIEDNEKRVLRSRVSK